MDHTVPVQELQLAWARLRVEVDCGLRRGAWYRVTRFTPSELFLDVQRYPMPVPRRFLEVMMGRPLRWSVVSRPPDPSKLPADLGAPYAVCPVCRARAPLRGRPAKMACPRCQGMFAVAWDERYLTKDTDKDSP
ncbi:MAG TPA: hypothetical protein VFD76_07180 [Gemmatimonadales bacterium]|jgi:hypothetical protein|nr:hypothetical protein [Gemmatimonadales bacterium]